MNSFSVKVKPVGNSPRVSEWQPLHKVSKSPMVFNDDDYAITIDNYGCVYVPGSEPSVQYRRNPDNPLEPPERVDAPTWAPGAIYEVEKILKAEKRKGVWWILVKWEGWTEPTEERRKDLLQDCTKEVRRLVLEACAHAVTRQRSVRIEDDEEFTYSASSDDDESETTKDESPIGEYVINEKAGLDDLGLSCTFEALLSCSDVIDQPCQRNEVKLSVAKIRLGIEALVLMV